MESESWFSIIIYSISEFFDPGRGVEKSIFYNNLQDLRSFPTQAVGSESRFSIIIYSISEFPEPGHGVGKSIFYLIYSISEFPDPGQFEKYSER